MAARVGGTAADRAGTEAPGPDGALAKLEAHFRSLDEPALLRVARAVELARAGDRKDPTDEQILSSLRPRLRELRPPRVPTLQRVICQGFEPFLHDGPFPEEKRRGHLSRAVLGPWWRLLLTSPDRQTLVALEVGYGKAVQDHRADAAESFGTQAASVALGMTATLLAEADRSIGRRAELAQTLGGEQGLADLRELALLLRLRPRLVPALDRVRQAAPLDMGWRVADFTPAAVIAARNAYLDLHDAEPELVEYLFLGLMGALAQPWQALRLVRVLSQDMSKAAGHPAALIPARLFSDLTRTLGEIGRQVGGEGQMSRRAWLLTCAKLVSDAGQMVKGLAEEGQVDAHPDWQKLLAEARQKVAQAVDGFAALALRECLQVLPVRQVREDGGQARQEPDMTRALTEEQVATAQAATVLFAAVRKLAEQERLDRSIRAKEADLEQSLKIGIDFRIEYLRARLKHGIAIAQLDAVHQVLKGLPGINIIRDLEYRVERTLERFRA
ncbi:hypothetical protein HHL28_05980 [Aerophototrophica crusticola]|uniref:Uncharacterized protein n=1 Tax=Aerophototrophica crusticola TaxID=1709002 RepID=A0A858R5M9_9PROT|nr:hypothetical protein HHL28_05980 [Rhodospirillaceae bacterium B3]